MPISAKMPAHGGLPDPDLDRQFYRRVPTKRLVAWFIDTLVTVIFSVIVGILTIGIGFILFFPLLFIIGFAYRTWTIASKSSTWGMRFMGIEFRDQNGDRFDTGQALAHSALFMILTGSVIGWVISALAMVGTRLGQGLPDMLLGSTAINSPAE